jgi:hypothetical protein
MHQDADGIEWWLTAVYGPAIDKEKQAFLAELHELRSLQSNPWLLTGDFNLIYRVEDKNNTSLDHQLMGQFWRFLNESILKEIHLNGRLFTWNNERTQPTLERIDIAFISKEWDESYPNHDICSINLEELDLPRLQLNELDNRFTEEGVWKVIHSLTPDKAQRPDGFTTRFLQTAWHITRSDLMRVLDAFWSLDIMSFHSLNQDLMVLLSKSPEASDIMDFRPIAFIKSVGKLVSKILDNRLSPRLLKLVHQS